MTAMFRPPVAVQKHVGAAQLLGFGQGDDPFWAQVRGAQLAALNRYVPFNVALMAVNVLALVIVFDGVGRPRFMAGWLLAMALLAGVWLRRWHRQRRGGEAVTASIHDFWMVTAEIAAFGLGWGVCMAALLPGATLVQQVVLVVLSLAAMGACGFAVAIMPVAGTALVTLIALATLASIPPASPLSHWIVSLCFATFALLIMRGIIVSSFELMARLRTQADHDEASAVIALLLNEFEANGSDWLIEVDATGKLTHVSPRLAEVAGRAHGELIGTSFVALLGASRAGSDARAGVRALAARFRRRRAFRDLVVPVMVHGETRWWSLSGTPKFDVGGSFAGFRGVGSDVTDVRRSQQQIAHLARFDPLTGLANRTLMREMIDAMLRQSLRGSEPCALMFIDLDRFKLVNDTLGHHCGDRLLRDVALRLRQAAGAGAQIGRLGGDEFAVALPDAGLHTAEATATAIVAALARPFTIDGKAVTIGASVGYAMGPVDGDSVDALLRCADLALYEVKANGRGHACRFVPAIRARAEERRMLEFDLAAALAKGQLRLAFQPVVDAVDERIVGFEALLRWAHPTLGEVPPLKFIPIAEETGHIVPIGAWVIAEACRWAARWPAHVRVAVNLSPAQFDDDRLPEIVAAALADNALDPDRIELEITESLFLNERPGTLAMLAAIKALGVRFALDDFGTGYSSLGYLRKVAFSRIKIDRSFVSRALNPSGESAAIIQAIVALANSLGMATTAEGTETRAEFETIRALGCGQVQGYLFGRPMPPEEATALVAPKRRTRAKVVALPFAPERTEERVAVTG
jgi:diguanylate cyclase (GGDEF)-like protein/PAS domain S-box-containing protein